ncbi:MAG: hypothetical protein SOV74_01420 [Coriobacteriales bacterium]|jgi:two-component system response regulator LytT|nr:hypothetical protein [Coriobacteriales bacterium]
MIFEAIIADDEAPARIELKQQLEDTGRVKVVDEAVSLSEAIAKMSQGAFDVAFIDWDIAGAGTSLLREALPKIKNVPLLVYMSAYSDYHPSPFGVEPLCHLIKPTDRSQLDEVIATIERAARRDS